MTAIPDYLINEAARAFQRRMRLAGSPPVWEDTPAHIQDVLREDASAILDAVADDLRAEAWDEGWRAGSLDVIHRYSSETPNPYLASEDE